jgi:hypothetical protein
VVILNSDPSLFIDKYINDYEYAVKGYVYLLTDGEQYKVGVTRGSIWNRIKKLQTGNPYVIQMIDCYETYNPFKIEKILHFRYSDKRVNNEWFDLNSDDVTNFKSTCEKIESMLESMKDNPYIK